jgi:hypothetical protein
LVRPASITSYSAYLSNAPSGVIDATDGAADGVYLTGNAVLTNRAGGVIGGSGAGVVITQTTTLGPSAMVTNAGTIVGNSLIGSSGIGVDICDIYGSGTVTNTATIVGAAQGVLIRSGTVINQSGGTILGSKISAVQFYSGGTILNAGTISFSSTNPDPNYASGLGAIFGMAGTTLTSYMSNAASGTVIGTTVAVAFNGPSGTLVNAGTIDGSVTGNRLTIINSDRQFRRHWRRDRQRHGRLGCLFRCGHDDRHTRRSSCLPGAPAAKRRDLLRPGDPRCLGQKPQARAVLQEHLTEPQRRRHKGEQRPDGRRRQRPHFAFNCPTTRRT